MADNERDLPIGPELAPSNVETGLKGEVVETRQEAVRVDVKELLQQRALELEILGWFKAGDINWVHSLMRDKTKWSDEFRQQVSAESEKYFKPHYSDFLLIQQQLGNDPWPKIQARCKEHFERGEWEEGIGIYEGHHPFSSKITYEMRVVPDEQLIACGRICRAKGNFENAIEAYSRVKGKPEAAEADEIIIWLLEGNHVADAADLAVSWGVTKYQAQFEATAREALEQGDLMGAYKSFGAAQFDIKKHEETRRTLVALAEYELAHEREKTINFRADSREETFRKTWDSAMEKKEGQRGDEREHFWAHPFQFVNVLSNPKGVRKAHVRRDVIQEIGTPDEVLGLVMHEQELGFAPPSYIIELLEKVGPQHPSFRPRLLDCIEAELKTAELALSGRNRMGMPDILGRREKRKGQAVEALTEVRRLCDMEGVNPPVHLVGRLARLYRQVGDMNAIEELCAKHGEPLRLELASDPMGKGRKESAEPLDPKTALSKLKQRIRSNKLRAVLKECTEYAQVAGLDAIREPLRKRAVKELTGLVEQMRTARAKKQEGGEEEKSSWGKESSVSRWNERGQEVMRAYELLGSATADEQALLSELALLLQQAYGDGGKAYGYTAWVDAHGPKQSVQIARSIYERLARQELGLPLVEPQQKEGSSGVDDEN